jgi:hypothetical protein
MRDGGTARARSRRRDESAEERVSATGTGQVTDKAAAAGRTLSSETLAGIDDVLSDAVERDGSLLESMSPKNRHT